MLLLILDKYLLPKVFREIVEINISIKTSSSKASKNLFIINKIFKAYKGVILFYSRSTSLPTLIVILLR